MDRETETGVLLLLLCLCIVSSACHISDWGAMKPRAVCLARKRANDVQQAVSISVAGRDSRVRTRRRAPNPLLSALFVEPTDGSIGRSWCRGRYAKRAPWAAAVLPLSQNRLRA